MLATPCKNIICFWFSLSDKFNEKSDVDLIVDIEDEDPFTYSENYFDLKFKLQDLLQRDVDLLEKKALKNIFLIKEIDNTKVLLYGK